MAESAPELTPQQQQFVEEFCKDRNQVRAALAAGLSDSYFPAAQRARELLKNPQIRAAIKYVFRVQARRLKTEVPDIVREWSILGKSDLDDYEVTAEGRVTTRPGVPRSALRAVKKVKQTRTERLTGRGDAQQLTVEIKTEIELHGKEGALAKLHEHLHGALPGGRSGSAEEVLGAIYAEQVATGQIDPTPPGGGGGGTEVAADQPPPGGGVPESGG